MKAACNIPYIARSASTYKVFFPFSNTTHGPYIYGANWTNLSTSTPVIFIITLSSPCLILEMFTCICIWYISCHDITVLLSIKHPGNHYNLSVCCRAGCIIFGNSFTCSLPIVGHPAFDSTILLCQ